MATVLIRLADAAVAEAVKNALAGGKHKIIEGEGLKVEDKPADVVESLLAEKPDAVIMDLLTDDAASVKVLQSSSDLAARPEFLFIDGETPASYDHILMAINEGARAVLPRNFRPAALVTYLERAISGPGRWRGRHHSDPAHQAELRTLEEQAGSLRGRTGIYEKLISFLLSTPPSAQPRRALLVSDSPYQLEFLKKQLGEYGFVVLAAANFKDGLAAALAEKPRIVISDLELDEGHTGLELCHEIKFTNKMIPCYFVICTANESKMKSILVPGNGVDDCLPKPGGQSGVEEFIARVSAGLLL